MTHQRTLTSANAEKGGELLSTTYITNRAFALLALFILFALFVSACGERGELKKANDERGILLLDHPTKTTIYFSDSVADRDRQLVEMAVDITRPLFESAGFALGADIYVAGDKDSYIESAQTKLGMSPELAEERYASTRGGALKLSAKVLINIPIHYDNYGEENRETALVFTVAHELYHILQARLSGGWSNVAYEPEPFIEFGESSANLGAYRAILNTFCVHLNDIRAAVSSFAKISRCPKEFLEESILAYAIWRFVESPAAGTGIELYIVSKFGMDIYDRLYAALPEASATFMGYDGYDLDALREGLWLKAIEKTLGVRSVVDLENDAIAYFEHMDDLALANLLKEYDDKYPSKNRKN